MSVFFHGSYQSSQQCSAFMYGLMSSRGGGFFLGYKIHFLKTKRQITKSRETCHFWLHLARNICQHMYYEHHSHFWCLIFVLVWVFVFICEMNVWIFSPSVCDFVFILEHTAFIHSFFSFICGLVSQKKTA